MCGIAGIYKPQFGDSEKSGIFDFGLKHRGPDDSGKFENEDIIFIHRRLSIIDPATGAQPMIDDSKRFVIIYNGECYNFKKIREDLRRRGYSFKTKSDTEVVLKGYIEFGVEFFNEINGMFALAIWDNEEKKLVLARDRFGMKPLYFAESENRVIFSSEFTPLVNAYPNLKKLDLNSLFIYLTLQSVPAPFTIFKGIKKLQPGCYLTCSREGTELKRYHRFEFEPVENYENEDQLLDKFWGYLESAVKARLVSDVPLGVFLSGGIDSTLIVAALYRLGIKKIKTFSVGFKGFEKNELNWARMVADKFKTDHKEIILGPGDLSVIDKLIPHFGEPYADTSAIPTYYISKAVSQDVKVVLGGDGGDEMMAGYITYQQLSRAFRWHPVLFFLFPIWYILGSFRFSPELDRIIRQLYFASNPKNEIYPLSRTYYHTQQIIKIMNKEVLEQVNVTGFDLFRDIMDSETGKNLMDRVFLADIKLPLASTLLPKVDIAGMANSLEIRAPFLDKHLADFSLGLDWQVKMKGNELKYISKQALKEYFSEDFIFRPKQGFTPPIKSWLRGENKDLLKEFISEKRIKKQGIFNHGEVNKIVNQFLNGRDDLAGFTWIIFNFMMWSEYFKPIQV